MSNYQRGDTVKMRGKEPSVDTVLQILYLYSWRDQVWAAKDGYGHPHVISEALIEPYTPPAPPKELTVDVLLAELRKKAAAYPREYAVHFLAAVFSGLGTQGYVIPEATE